MNLTHPIKPSVCIPNVIVPRHMLDTFSPVLPKKLYSTLFDDIFSRSESENKMALVKAAVCIITETLPHGKLIVYNDRNLVKKVLSQGSKIGHSHTSCSHSLHHEAMLSQGKSTYIGCNRGGTELWFLYRAFLDNALCKNALAVTGVRQSYGYWTMLFLAMTFVKKYIGCNRSEAELWLTAHCFSRQCPLEKYTGCKRSETELWFLHTAFLDNALLEKIILAVTGERQSYGSCILLFLTMPFGEKSTL